MARRTNSWWARHGRTLGPSLVAILLLAALAAGLSGARSCAPDEAAPTQTTLVTLLGEALTSVPDTAASATPATAVSATPATLLRVVDGDTIWVVMADGREEKVRYIGIDAPEVAHGGSAGEYLGEEASFHNERLLASGALHLETDADERDDFGRLLAYVWAGDVFVNERMVADGYARARNYPPNLSRQEELWAAHDAAREAGVGIWGESGE